MYCHFLMRETGLQLLLVCKSSGVETLPSKFCLKKKKYQARGISFGGSFSLQICFLWLERGNVLPPLPHTPPKKESEEEVSSSVNAAK